MSDTPLLTVAEVATRLQCSTDTVYALVARQKIGHVRVGDGTRPRLRFTPEDVETYVAKQRRAPLDELTPAKNTPQRAPQRRLLDLPEASRYV